MNIVDNISLYLNPKESVLESKGRRTLLKVMLLLPVLAACSNLPLSKVTNGPLPTPNLPVKEFNSPLYSKELRPGISFSVYGEDTRIIKDPLNLPEIEYLSLQDRLSFTKDFVPLGEEINLAVIKIGVNDNLDYPKLIGTIYSNTKEVINTWVKDLNIKVQNNFHFSKGNHTITISNAIIHAGDGNLYFPLCDFTDSKLSDFITEIKNQKRQIHTVMRGEGGFTFINTSPEISNSLIGINLASMERSAEIYRESGINLSKKEVTELVIVNEFASLFLDQMIRNDLVCYNKLAERLKGNYGFPPDNNPEFNQQLTELSKSPIVSIDKLRERVTNEALTTLLMYDYMQMIFHK